MGNFLQRSSACTIDPYRSQRCMEELNDSRLDQWDPLWSWGQAQWSPLQWLWAGGLGWYVWAQQGLSGLGHPGSSVRGRHP